MKSCCGDDRSSDPTSSVSTDIVPNQFPKVLIEILYSIAYSNLIALLSGKTDKMMHIQLKLILLH